MYLIGITGSIGSGKTTLANIAKELGYAVYDVDGWVRNIYSKPSFLRLLEKFFEGSVKDGVADKRYLREIVFNDKKQLEKLESLIYPILNNNIKNLITKNAKQKFIIFLDIALLFEKKWDKYCDFIILADADYELRKKRVMLRDKVSALGFENIDKVQMNNDKKKDMVDIVINTDKSVNILKVEMINLINAINGE